MILDHQQQPCRFVMVTAAKEAKIVAGDLVMWRHSKAYPARDTIRLMTSLDVANAYQAENRQRMRKFFSGCFLGVSLEHSPPGVADRIRVATSGVFLFDCVPDFYELGRFIGPALIDRDTSSQKVCRARHGDEAFGLCATGGESIAERVSVEIFSRVMRPL